ncbi:hypothetical protein F2P81_005620 [Scophthalmus maximus]|uniref:Uncharacterized protein n=1 Tax=Scophthalmus maximus TaxID=52904 RepID=A0A6A4TCG2_SCOMX|nr:hypothetical protein F2P81_005620 [Scophthalmus maximus]
MTVRPHPSGHWLRDDSCVALFVACIINWSSSPKVHRREISVTYRIGCSPSSLCQNSVHTSNSIEQEGKHWWTVVRVDHVQLSSSVLVCRNQQVSVVSVWPTTGDTVIDQKEEYRNMTISRLIV